MLKFKELLRKKRKHSEIVKKAPIFERCVICKNLTDVLIDTPIDLRQNYIQGCGQLCPECAERAMNHSAHNGITVSYDDMEKLVTLLREQARESKE